MKKITVLLCVLCTLLLSACKPNTLQDPNETGTPTQTTTQTPTQTTTQTPTQSTAPTKDPACQEMDALFGDWRSWYNQALVALYDTPADISLQTLFYGGFEGESHKPTDAEWEELKDQPGFREEYDLIRLPKDKMNQVLTAYFGITLEDVSDTGFAGLVYLDSTGCYYHMATGANSLEDFEATHVQTLEDGTVQVSYTTGGESRVVTLIPEDDGYRIVSNKQA